MSLAEDAVKGMVPTLLKQPTEPIIIPPLVPTWQREAEDWLAQRGFDRDWWYPEWQLRIVHDNMEEH